MTLYCKSTFCKKHPLIICTELLLIHLCLEALEKVLLSAQSYISASVKDLNIQVLKPNDSTDSVNYAIFLSRIIFVCRCLEEYKYENIKIKTKASLSRSLYLRSKKKHRPFLRWLGIYSICKSFSHLAK